MSLVMPRKSPPIMEMLTLAPVEIIHTPAGETVLDMGQNMVGFLSFYCDAPTGTEIMLQFGEVLQEDNFYNDNLRTAKAEFRYIASGKPHWVRPEVYVFRLPVRQAHQMDGRGHAGTVQRHGALLRYAPNRHD